MLSGSLGSGLSTNSVYWLTWDGNNAPYGGASNVWLVSSRVIAAAVGSGTLPWAPNQGALSYSQVPLPTTCTNDGGKLYVCVSQGTAAASGGPTGLGSAITDGTITWSLAGPPFTTQGSGTISVIPMMATYPFTSTHLLDSEGDRIWVGATKPPILVGHNFAYLSQKSKCIPPYVVGLTMSNWGTPYNYSPGNQMWYWDFNAGGDNVGDNRIGYINDWAIRSLYNPFDKNNDISMKSLCLSFFEQHFWEIDETVGNLPIWNNGPSNSGSSYTNFGSSNPNGVSMPFIAFGTPTTPVQVGPSAAEIDQPGFYERYGTWCDTSHCPSPWIVPFLKTGNDEWREPGLILSNHQLGNYLTYGTPLGGITISGTTYWRPDILGGQVRGMGWGARQRGMSLHFLPANDPALPYWRDLMASNSGYFALAPATLTSQERTMGLDLHNMFNGATSQQNWMLDICYLGIGMEAVRGEYAGITSWITTFFSNWVLARAIASYGTQGCQFAGPIRYFWPFNGNTGLVADLFTNFNSVYVNTAPQEVPGTMPNPWTGCPVSGFALDPGDSAAQDPNWIGVYWTSAVAIGSLLSMPGTAALYAAVRAYQAALTPTPFSWGSTPEWAIGPLGASY